jgi:hypothetical protein
MWKDKAFISHAVSAKKKSRWKVGMRIIFNTTLTSKLSYGRV